MNFQPHLLVDSGIKNLTENAVVVNGVNQMACQSSDMKSLKALQADLWPLLTTEQNHLLHLVLTEHSKPSGGQDT